VQHQWQESEMNDRMVLSIYNLSFLIFNS